MPVTTIADPDPLAPLWKKAQEAAAANDMPGVLFVWKSLADKGVWQLCVSIGELYEKGAVGVRQDPVQSVYWYRKAVYEGDDPQAHIGLGRAYYNGVGTERNLETAHQHFERAFTSGRFEAGIYLGIMYYFGVGVSQDINRSEKYLEVAAQADYAYACFLLSRIALRRLRLIRAVKFLSEGLRIGVRLANKDPGDPRLLGIKVPPK